MTTFRELLEQVAENNRIRIPDAVRFPTNPKYRKILRPIEREIDEYHRSKEVDNLRRSVELSLNVIAQMLDDITQSNLERDHDYRVSRSKIASLTTIKKIKKDLSDEEL